MERIKDMDLKKALFTLAALHLLAATVLAALAFWGCLELSAALPNGTRLILQGDGSVQVVTVEPTGWQQLARTGLALLQFALPALFYIVALALTVSRFYRWKLARPLASLTAATGRMMAQDLDFTLTAPAPDELGQLCEAFETMRSSLLRSHRELWRQAEEHKRLNAAFSHELRNPLTVLKGSTKLAQKAARNGQQAQLLENLERIDHYTCRIQRYVETMSSVQRLEQLHPEPRPVSSASLNAQLEKALALAAGGHGKSISFQPLSADAPLMLDEGMFLQILENLTANALRFASSTVSVALTQQAGMLALTVTDDGPGFPDSLLSGGVRPFQKGSAEVEHFGMGLYLCRLLCEKQGGELLLENTPQGAKAVAKLPLAP